MTFQVRFTPLRPFRIPIGHHRWSSGKRALPPRIRSSIRSYVSWLRQVASQVRKLSITAVIWLRMRDSKRGYGRPRAGHRRPGMSHYSPPNSTLIPISGCSLLSASVSTAEVYHVNTANLTIGYTYSRSCKTRRPSPRLVSLISDRYSNTFLTNLTNRFFLPRDAGRQPRNQGSTEGTSFAFTSVFVDMEALRSQEPSHAHGDGRSSVIG